MSSRALSFHAKLSVRGRGHLPKPLGPKVLKKLFKVLGIIALTLVGLIGIVAIHSAVINERVPVGLLGNGKVFVGNWDNGFVHAKGTWVIDGERSAHSLNLSSILCLREQNLCHVADASVSDGVMGGTYLDADVNTYDIKRWDASTIEYNTEAVCVTYAYVIDRATEKLIGRRLKKPDAKDDVCGSVGSDYSLSFVNGLDVVERLRQERAPNTISIVSATAFGLLMLAWAWRVIRKP